MYYLVGQFLWLYIYRYCHCKSRQNRLRDTTAFYVFRPTLWKRNMLESWQRWGGSRPRPRPPFRSLLSAVACHFLSPNFYQHLRLRIGEESTVVSFCFQGDVSTSVFPLAIFLRFVLKLEISYLNRVNLTSVKRDYKCYTYLYVMIIGIDQWEKRWIEFESGINRYGGSRFKLFTLKFKKNLCRAHPVRG